MSGGSLNYVYTYVEDAAREVNVRATCIEHRAFASHLRKVAKALRELEWVLSGDNAEGDEMSAIREVVSDTTILHEAIDRAKAIMEELREEVARIEAMK